jgi:hypothetical protein
MIFTTSLDRGGGLLTGRPTHGISEPSLRLAGWFIIRPFPLMGTTNPARDDQLVVPKCAAYFLGYAK